MHAILKIFRKYDHMKLLCFIDSQFSNGGCDPRWSQPYVGTTKTRQQEKDSDQTTVRRLMQNPAHDQLHVLLDALIRGGTSLKPWFCVHHACTMCAITPQSPASWEARALTGEHGALWTAAFALCTQSLLLFQKHNGFITAEKDLLDLPVSLLSTHVSN